ncbi:hypothetical protein [Aquimarina muelleri]|uniref:Uncharacterized protein n=1 Tax=Aquimarina muelleri TaxID=279356 RepID=A0A918JYB0_9FLAO|nr:hypothetical protein [Aquimarina muelleri]MCX2763685.1 hypothetical protein [Aquimarina muelleri]GGX30324.1 hypothetical protein GCM10007384_34300 [Aquimarina muelleri]
MAIHLNIQNNSGAAQNVTVTNNEVPSIVITGPINVPVGGPTDILNVPEANVTLKLICNGNVGQAATLNVVYHGASSVEQNSDWNRQWHVDGYVTGLILTLT